MPAKTGSKTKSKGGLGRGISNLINVDDLILKCEQLYQLRLRLNN